MDNSEQQNNSGSANNQAPEQETSSSSVTMNENKENHESSIPNPIDSQKMDKMNEKKFKLPETQSLSEQPHGEDEDFLNQSKDKNNNGINNINREEIRKIIEQKMYGGQTNRNNVNNNNNNENNIKELITKQKREKYNPILTNFLKTYNFDKKKIDDVKNDFFEKITNPKNFTDLVVKEMFKTYKNNYIKTNIQQNMSAEENKISNMERGKKRKVNDLYEDKEDPLALEKYKKRQIDAIVNEELNKVKNNSRYGYQTQNRNLGNNRSNINRFNNQYYQQDNKYFEQPFDNNVVTKTDLNQEWPQNIQNTQMEKKNKNKFDIFERFSNPKQTFISAAYSKHAQMNESNGSVLGGLGNEFLENFMEMMNKDQFIY